MSSPSPDSTIPSEQLLKPQMYSRKTLLSLSKSPLSQVAPEGLRALQAWFGDYEAPTHSLPSNHNNNARRDVTGRRPNRYDSADPNESYGGSMGDFKLPSTSSSTLNGHNTGASRRNRPMLDSRTSHNNEESHDGRRMRDDGRREVRAGERRGGLEMSKDQSGDRRRDPNNAGRSEKDRRDARSDEPGWREKRPTTTTTASKGMQIPGTTERKPAWMDDQDSALARSPPAWTGFNKEKPVSPTLAKAEPPSRSNLPTSNPASNQTKPPVDEIQAWKAEMKAMEAQQKKSTTSIEPQEQTTRPVEHIDEIQKFKAEMREMERKRKEASQPKGDAANAPASQELPTQKPPPSLYDDLKLSSTVNKPTSPPTVPESTGGRSASRFAKYFKPESSTSPSPPVPSLPSASPAQSIPATDANSLMAALLNSGKPQQSQSYQQPQQHIQQQQQRPPQASPPVASAPGDSEMARVLQMLHLSSQPIPSAPTPATHAQPQYPYPLPHQQQQLPQQQQQRMSSPAQRLPRSSNPAEMQPHSLPGLINPNSAAPASLPYYAPSYIMPAPPPMQQQQHAYMPRFPPQQPDPMRWQQEQQFGAMPPMSQGVPRGMAGNARNGVRQGGPETIATDNFLGR